MRTKKRFRCLFGIHPGATAIAWNAGIWFGLCTTCRHDVVREFGRPWRRVPRGWRIVWRRLSADHVRLWDQIDTSARHRPDNDPVVSELPIDRLAGSACSHTAMRKIGHIA